jgi:hypothetical protein
MPTQLQRQFVRTSVVSLADAMFQEEQLERRDWLEMRALLRKPSIVEPLTVGLFGRKREAAIPGTAAKVVNLSLFKRTGARFNLIVFRPQALPPKRMTCFVGHRFTPAIEQRLRWNLRQLFDIFGIQAHYLGFDGGAVRMLDELSHRIEGADFCLFDNQDTTKPSRPNVYIETGMALALNRPFVFCHYQREVWPSDFGGVLYLSYKTYEELFANLYRKLPIFLNKVREA